MIENKLDWHGKPIALEVVYNNVTSLMKNKDIKLVPTGPDVKDWFGDLPYKKGDVVHIYN